MNKKTIYIGADHGGYELKEKVKIWLDNWGYEFEDSGAYQLVQDDDYPAYAFDVAIKVAADKNSIGVLLCRSGGGMIIAANKVKGIRALAVGDEKSAVHAKEHNDVNVISLSADWNNQDQTKEILLAFLNASFAGEERHVRRIKKITEFEE